MLYFRSTRYMAYRIMDTKKRSFLLLTALSTLFFSFTPQDSSNSVSLSFSQLDSHTPFKEEVAATDYEESVAVNRQRQSLPNEVKTTSEGPIINFNDVEIVEFLRFVSRLTGKNFIFDPDELRFSVTIISESTASLDEIMAALLQNLRIHGFELIEEGSNFLIHRNKEVKSPAGIFQGKKEGITTPQIATQVFHIQYVDPERVASIVKTMLSFEAPVELIPESKRVVVTDTATNIRKVADLLSKLDVPNSGLEVGQYVAQVAPPATLITMIEKMLEPLTTGQTFTAVPNFAANSVFIISTPFIVEKALSLMQKIDLGEIESGSLSLDTLRYDPELNTKFKEKTTQKAREKEVARQRALDQLSSIPDDQLRDILRGFGFTEDEINSFTRGELENNVQKQLQQEVSLGLLQGISTEELHKKMGLGKALPSGLFPSKPLQKLDQDFLNSFLPLAKEEVEAKQRSVFESGLPVGQLESTQFSIHKMQYRDAKEIVRALRSIASSLQGAEKGENSSQSDLIVTLNAAQIIEQNNSIVLTGTNQTIKKAKDLIGEIDIPVRQVFIEVLAVETTIKNTLNFGVEWASKAQRRNFAIEGGLYSTSASQLKQALTDVTQVNPRPAPPLPHASYPADDYDMRPNTILGTTPREGFTTGSIGRKIFHNGHAFFAMTSLINALRTDDDTHIMFAPKITVEHNIPAELYFGDQVGIKGQSVSNDDGSILTTNYETRETGVTLKVTPLISSKETITLIIEQKISQASGVDAQGDLNAPPATISETRTTTRIHMPDQHFLVLSGLTSENQTRIKDQIPCLGSLPIIGSLLFANNNGTGNKRALLLFIKPHIIDTEADLDEVTQKQQDNYDKLSKPMKKQRGVLDDAKEMLNF